MKKITNSLVLKIFAVFMSLVIFCSFLISVLGISFMVFNDFYTLSHNECRDRIITDMAENELQNLIDKYEWERSELKKYYSYKNIFYKFESENGEVVTNYDGIDAIVTVEKNYSVEEFFDENGVRYTCNEVSYYEVNNEVGWHTYNNIPVKSTNIEAKFTIYIPDRMKYTDSFYIAKAMINFGYNNRYTLIFVAAISAILSVVIYSYLFFAVGHGKSGDDIYVCALNKLPADIMTAVAFGAFLLGVLFLLDKNAFITALIVFVIVVPILYFVLLWYVLSLAAQIKAKTLIKHTVIYFISKQFIKLFGAIKYLLKNLATAYKTAFVLAILLVLQLIFIGINFYENDNLVLGWLLYTAIISVALLLASIAFGKVKRGGEKIVDGDLESKIDTQYMYGDIKDFAESLNNINNGLQLAINDKVKSERFKTELITNVSHDIKTPLTSIVNYVDLIKKEKCENENINQYIDVLDRQSIRLKKLIEDLVEASKASTGNITVELAKCNLSVLINQAVGEFEEKLKQSNLFLIQNIENQEIFVLADGRRLWRVFDNLLNNICKYAMGGTRVYIDLTTNDNKAIITFKNISSTPLTVSGDDLSERFVRGDRSRNTEGSGLGLSIAKSLTVLQNGSFKIETDGDLFKATLIFDLIN